MKKYKVIVTCGAYDAPSIYVDAANEKDAIQQAKSKSGLSRFDNWQFIALSIN